jgi:uncharacterized protein YdgA (DUF945 family)
MKKLIKLLVILTVIIFASYYGMGIITERTIKHNLATFNKTNGLSLQLINYKHKWFTSNALLKGQLYIPDRIIQPHDSYSQVISEKNYDLQIPLKIYHGPFIFANHTVKFGLGYATLDLVLPLKYQQEFNQLFTLASTKPKLQASLFITYLNTSQIKFSLPTFKLITKQGMSQFNWHGLTSTTTVTSNIDKIKGHITLNGFQASKDNMTTTVNSMKANYTMHNTKVGLYLGQATVSLPSLIVNTPVKKLFELDNFKIHSDSDIKEGLFNSYFDLSIARIFVIDQLYGPGKLRVAVRNLDAQTLAHINQQIKIAQQSNDVEKQKVLFAMLAEVPKLVNNGAEFEVSELSVVTPQGIMAGNVLLSLPKNDTTNIFEFIQKIQGKGELTISSPVLNLILNESNKQKLAYQDMSVQPQLASSVPTIEEINNLTTSQIEKMLNSGLLIAQGNDYRIAINLDKGQLQINGKPFNSAMIKF